MNGLERRVAFTVLSEVTLATLVASTCWAQAGNPGHTTGIATDHAMVQMSHEAVRIFNEAGMATNSLASGNKAAALHDINEAISIRDRLAMTASSHNLPKIVPIFSEVEQESTLGPVLAQKNNGQATPPAKVPVTVDAANDQFTFVGIDLDKTKQRLQGAKDAIDNNNTQAAKDTLNAIGSDLVVLKVSADAPLLAIRENLGVAQTAASKHQEHEATAALQEASSELSSYAQMGSAKHAQEAKQLKSSVDGMLSSSSEKNASASTTIGKWWGEVNGWMQSPSA